MSLINPFFNFHFYFSFERTVMPNNVTYVLFVDSIQIENDTKLLIKLFLFQCIICCIEFSKLKIAVTYCSTVMFDTREKLINVFDSHVW